MDNATLRKIREAVIKGDNELVKQYIRPNCEVVKAETPFGTWLHIAASHGNNQIVPYLVECGIDPNTEGGIADDTPISRASSKGHIDIVRFLLSCGAKLDVSEPDKNPLFSAIYGGHKDIVQLLLDSGIDASVRYTGKYMKHMDAYDFAIERGQKEIAEMLLPYRK